MSEGSNGCTGRPSPVRRPGPHGETEMNPEYGSVFDLSPSEKLQLVEDLWDDLAATSGAVPVHYWQKGEMDRRKANLVSHPDSGMTWVDIQRRIRSRHGR